MKKNKLAEYLFKVLTEIVETFAFAVLAILFFLSVLAGEGDFGEAWKVPGMIVVITGSTVVCIAVTLLYLSGDEEDCE